MSKSAAAVTIVIPVHNSAESLNSIVPVWGTLFEKYGRQFEILIVDDGSTDSTTETATKLATRVPHTRLLKHDTQKGYGACVRTALVETKTPLFFYTAVDYPYTPSDIRQFLDRIELRDEILHKQPDLISGCRMGLSTPGVIAWLGKAWKVFWRIFAGLPMSEPTPWHGWREFWFSFRMRFLYSIPLVDVNSCFKLIRTDFLKKFPIQSDGDFLHTELVAKATFMTSIMDEVPLTPKPSPLPSLGSMRSDGMRVFSHPEFAFPPPPPPTAPATSAAPIAQKVQADLTASAPPPPPQEFPAAGPATSPP